MVKMVIVGTILTLAFMYDWPLYQMDVDNAFLQGVLNENIYMTLPQGFFKQ